MEIVGTSKMWRMKTYKGMLYSVQDEIGRVFQVFINQHNKHDMCCSCGKQEKSRLCPHIKYLEETLYLSQEVESTLVIVDTRA